jgi:hypothetical protein
MSKLENEKRCLEEELARNESRATRLELRRLSLERELQRLQMIPQEKDSYPEVTGQVGCARNESCES